MQNLRKYALAVSIAASLLLTNAAFAAPRDGGESTIEHIKSKIRAFLIHILDDNGMSIPPGSH